MRKQFFQRNRQTFVNQFESDKQVLISKLQNQFKIKNQYANSQKRSPFFDILNQNHQQQYTDSKAIYTDKFLKNQQKIQITKHYNKQEYYKENIIKKIEHNDRFQRRQQNPQSCSKLSENNSSLCFINQGNSVERGTLSKINRLDLNQGNRKSKESLQDKAGQQKKREYFIQGEDSIQILSVIQQPNRKSENCSDNKYKLQINEQAIDYLIKIQNQRLYEQSHQGNKQSQFAFCSILGKTKTGKSFLLNELLRKQRQSNSISFHQTEFNKRTKQKNLNNQIVNKQGYLNTFAINHTVSACTKGIWISRKTIRMQEDNRIKDIFMIDTQGLGSYDSTQQIDYKIFMLTILISDLICYNSTGPIDQQMMNGLYLSIQLSKLLDGQNGKKPEDDLKSKNSQCDGLVANKRQRNMPGFIWVLRDFSLQFLDLKKQSIDADIYLQNCLQVSSDLDKDSLNKEFNNKNNIQNNYKLKRQQNKKIVRKSIKQLFPNRKCTAFIVPFDQNGQKRIQFDRNMQQLKKKMHQLLFLNQSADSNKTSLKKSDLKQVTFENSIQRFICKLKGYTECLNNSISGQNDEKKKKQDRKYTFPKLLSLQWYYKKSQIINLFKKNTLIIQNYYAKIYLELKKIQDMSQQGAKIVNLENNNTNQRQQTQYVLTILLKDIQRACEVFQKELCRILTIKNINKKVSNTALYDISISNLVDIQASLKNQINKILLMLEQLQLDTASTQNQQTMMRNQSETQRQLRKVVRHQIKQLKTKIYNQQQKMANFISNFKNLRSQSFAHKDNNIILQNQVASQEKNSSQINFIYKKELKQMKQSINKCHTISQLQKQYQSFTFKYQLQNNCLQKMQIQEIKKQIQIQYLRKKVEILQHKHQSKLNYLKGNSQSNQNRKFVDSIIQSKKQAEKTGLKDNFDKKGYNQCFNCQKSFYNPYIIIPVNHLQVKILRSVAKKYTFLAQNQFNRQLLSSSVNALLKHEFILQVKLNGKIWYLKRKLKDFVELYKILRVMFSSDTAINGYFSNFNPRASKDHLNFTFQSDSIPSLLQQLGKKQSSEGSQINLSSQNYQQQNIKHQLSLFLNQLNQIQYIRNSRIFQKFIKINKQYLNV